MLVRIIEIHKDDYWYDERDRFIGQVFEIDFINQKYCFGWVGFEFKYNDRSEYFSMVKIEEIESENKLLKDCPFCGSEAKIISSSDTYQVVGCSEKFMSCPNPNIVVYKNDNKEWDYRFWNKRV